jgi:2,3-bisphosphoglycerate-independent phosphoglycerate mutase
MTDGKLADVVPTLLAIMGLKQPEDMTGKNLLI